jgi:hypothetical protein
MIKLYLDILVTYNNRLGNIHFPLFFLYLLDALLGLLDLSIYKLDIVSVTILGHLLTLDMCPCLVCRLYLLVGCLVGVVLICNRC